MRLILILLAAAILPAQINEPRRAEHPKIFALTELARSAPPEFAARGLLQLLDAGAIPTQDWQFDIAQEALSLSASARHPLKKRLAPGINAPDTRAMVWTVAYREGLDALSLSLRAIQHLPPETAKKAFSQLPRPAPKQATCKDAILDDISQWFQTAARLRIDPLPLIQSIQTHGEIGPAIDLIFSGGTIELHIGALAQKLRELPVNDRSFNAALFETPRKLQKLSQQRPAAALDDAWRAWMQSGLEAPACQESRTAGPQQEARHEAFRLLNQSLSPDLLKPSGTSEPANLEPFASTEATSAQAKHFKQLLFGNQNRVLSEQEKDTPEWREQMQTFIQSIESRTRTAEETDIEFFYRQSQLWAGVLMASPAGPTRDRARNQSIGFLLANAPHIDPLIWFSQVQSLAELARSLHGSDFARTLNDLHQTAHPVLRLYAELESAYPTRPKVN